MLKLSGRCEAQSGHPQTSKMMIFTVKVKLGSRTTAPPLQINATRTIAPTIIAPWTIAPQAIALRQLPPEKLSHGQLAPE